MRILRFGFLIRIRNENTGPRYTRVAGNQIRAYDILHPALITTIPHLNPYANVTSKISERAIPRRGEGERVILTDHKSLM